MVQVTEDEYDYEQILRFGEKEGTCTNEAGTPWTPLWCLECDEKRRSHITSQLEDILGGLSGPS